jgi:bifunctional non-homologous end joining protein LigD
LEFEIWSRFNAKFLAATMRRLANSGLKTYRAKRDFGVTAEPKGKIARKRGSAFVIQKHDATRLHYDLRLELDGVMKSWAVTRGPSLVPGEKRLAVEVEDHPIAYNTFEGTIPKGEYGGGTVMVWDRGHWLPESDPHKGLAKGHLVFTLEGKKLHGGWHLVRMRRRPGEKRDNWLLIKQDDDAGRSPKDEDILEEKPLSAASGRSMEQIAKGSRKVWHSNRAKDRTVPKTHRAAATTKKNVPRARTKKNDPDFDAGTSALPAFVPPCLASLSDRPPDQGNWVHELKFDGYRIQARLDHGKATLLTRKGLDWTKKFSTIAKAIAKLPAKNRAHRWRTRRRRKTTGFPVFLCCSRISKVAATTA